MIRLKVITTVVLLEDITKIHWDKIWKIHRALWKVLSNKGPQFASKFIEDLTKALGIKTLFTVYHSQTDGQTKWINQEVKAFLQHYVNY